ncbi:MAG: ROK family protein [Candidatus Bipolaricaulaceae bacterium]
MWPPKANHELLRDHNRRLVMKLLRDGGPMSRSELAQHTGLAPSVLTRLVRRLLADGVVVEAGKRPSRGGRRATLLAVDPGYAHVVGVKVERERVLAARVDLAGRIQGRADVPLAAPPDPDLVLGKVVEVVGSLRTGRILGVGVAVSGLVDAARGMDLYSPILGWHNVPVADSLRARLRLPVWVENDVNALTLAEQWYGAGRGYRSFVCLTVGEGIGAGLVVSGELYRGAFGGAGEVGHTTLDPQGPRCRCGQQGCLEMYASDHALSAAAAALGYQGIDELAAAARAGSEPARRAFAEMGNALGIGAKNLVNLVNPEALVLGGERMEMADLFLPEFEDQVRQHSFPEEAKDLVVLPAELGRDGFIVGAATLGILEWYRMPTEDKVR